jgi:hypothetical protein
MPISQLREAAVRKDAALLFTSLLLLYPTASHADIAAIQADQLPKDKQVLDALRDAQEMEPYSYVWVPSWTYSVPKAEVAKHLEKDVKALNQAIKSYPENNELALLAGMVGHYAYNVDVDGSGEFANGLLEQTVKQMPSDVRPVWFQASFYCETVRMNEEGAGEFLSIEASHAWDQLPAAFWRDYMQCAEVTGQYVHALRAASHIEKLRATNFDRWAILNRILHDHIAPFDPGKHYQPAEVWQLTGGPNAPAFTSTICGLRFRVKDGWRGLRMEISNGSCVAQLGTGTYEASTTDLSPNILVMVQQPEAGEALQEYSKRFMSDGKFEPDLQLKCPVTNCIAMKAIQPQMYVKNGGGHGRLIVFERDQPEYPGLIFEGVRDSSSALQSGENRITHLPEIQQRIPGKLYYVLVLDTAASIEEPAMKDFDFFLTNLVVE